MSSLPLVQNHCMKSCHCFIFFLFGLIVYWNNLNGQTLSESSRNQGIGGATVALNDLNSIWSNQAGLAYIDNAAATVFVQQLYGTSELRSIGIAAMYPTSSGTFGLSLNYLGIPEYQDQQIALTYSRLLLDRLSIGAQILLQNLSIEEYGDNTTFAFELGLLAELIPKVHLGVHISNPIRSALLEDEDLPTTYSLGFAYRPSRKTLITGEVEKDIEYPVRVKMGVEYFFIEQFALRTGISTQPTNIHFGLGYLPSQQLSVDIAFSQHLTLGFTPGIGVSYQF